MKIRFVGDIHAHYAEYFKLIKGCEKSIQLGDFGIGFATVPKIKRNHRFIRGNHDNPDLIKDYPNFIPDGSTEIINNSKLFFLGGANSVDKNLRIEGVSYWKDEELGYKDYLNILNSYESERPNVVITHACPSTIAAGILETSYDNLRKSKTESVFQEFLSINKPELWIFGHYHRDFDKTINGTRFICVKTLTYRDIEI